MTSVYWENLRSAIHTSFQGLKATFRHLVQARHTTDNGLPVSHPDYFEGQSQGIMTLQYPHERFPVPDNGRYKLHNEIDDCIVCDKCAKICPVDCIEIEPIKATETYGHTSDGTPKRIYAAKFDIDMGKCCFCGLCTTVCPTECLTMTKSFDFSEYDVADHNFSFATMTPLEILEKKTAWTEAQAQKQQARVSASGSGKSTPPRPVTKRPAKPKTAPKEESSPEVPKSESVKPKFRPRPMIKKKKQDE